VPELAGIALQPIRSANQARFRVSVANSERTGPHSPLSESKPTLLTIQSHLPQLDVVNASMVKSPNVQHPMPRALGPFVQALLPKPRGARYPFRQKQSRAALLVCTRHGYALPGGCRARAIVAGLRRAQLNKGFRLAKLWQRPRRYTLFLCSPDRPDKRHTAPVGLDLSHRCDRTKDRADSQSSF
jgi:hypothetical protein